MSRGFAFTMPKRTRSKNLLWAKLAQASQKRKLDSFIKCSEKTIKFLVALQQYGYLHGFTRTHGGLSVRFNRDSLGNNVIRKIYVFSRPSRHLYISAKHLDSYMKLGGLTLLSTSKGVMSAQDAKRSNTGGELLIRIV